MRRRSLITLTVPSVIAILLLPTISNVSAGTLPETWKPYLWLSWPVTALLAAPLIYHEVFQRHQRLQATPGLGAVTEDQKKRLDQAATDLAYAVHQQWAQETRLRSLQRPEPIRVRWSTTDRPVAAKVSAVTREGVIAGRLLRLRGDGQQAVELFRKLRVRQLVVLGDPGAGKTVFALLLTLHLLESRVPDEPVPVLLPIASWNPRDEHPYVWLARRLVEEYPALANHEIYGPGAAMRLVTEGLVMPVLDGLDEMPTELQADALDALDHAVTGEYPLVLTCRSVEYQAAVERNGAMLTRAIVVEIEPVDIDDAETFLIAGTLSATRRWQPVLDHLRAYPDAVLAQVLRSPLMITLARTIYTAPSANPGELLDSSRFPDRSAIEHHMLGAFVPSVYRNSPTSVNMTQTQPRYDPERAREWLTFLARHLNRLGTRDLSWWQFVSAMPRAARGLLAALLGGILFWPPGFVTGSPGAGPEYAMVHALSFGLACGFAYGMDVSMEPSRMEIRFRGTARAFLGRFAGCFALGLALGLAAGLPWKLTIAVGLTFGLCFGAGVWLDTPTEATTESSPDTVLKQDRTAALALSLTMALSFGLFGGLSAAFATGLGLTTGDHSFVNMLGGAIAGGVAGGVAGGLVYRWVGGIAFGIAGATVGAVTFGPAASQAIVGLPYGIALGLAIGCMGLGSRAWGAFTITRGWLALRGRQPWRLMRFLQDAHRRGVLRQSGSVYQFRHARLQDHLAVPMGHDESSSTLR